MKTRPLPKDLSSFTGFLLAKAFHRISALIMKAAGECGLPDIRCAGIMAALVEWRTPTQKELCDALRIDRSSMVTLIDLMEKAGLARRAPHPSDRRARIVELLPEGLSMFKTFKERARKLERSFLPGYRAAEREQIRAALMLMARFPAPPK